MELLIVVVFIIGYTFIALEHPLKIDKAASALLTGVFCWLVLVFGLAAMPAAGGVTEPQAYLHDSLSEHLSSISEILFFLLGAMTIVELVDVHDGFRVITDRIVTTNRVKLLWIISWVAFFLSSVLDNMTTAIIMSALLRKLIKKQEDLWFYGGFVIIAANAGGAWSPIGDVTTIMLWIGGQVTTLEIMKNTFLVSVVCMLAPLLVATVVIRRKGGAEEMGKMEAHSRQETTPFERSLLFFLGVAALLFVPVFKTVTHMPPYMGILLSLGVLWYVTEFLHRGKESDHRHQLSVAAMLRRIDTPAILFFLGILLAVGALESSGHLHLMSEVLNRTFGDIYVINTLIGLLSAVVDNVPLVAASMGMYDMTEFPPNHDFWNLMAYCAGTGGSILIIGSAAGVASMGILKVDFLWYLKHISIYAAIGYFAGIAVYYLEHMVM
ncbi:MAG: sodium:proton antiporter NhaD [Saprospirales bacterium]|nr:sodium:proton antiporter NhaD [Saprospirales bacterium]MBK8921528.1 sodium:proton antiporter NhaD [Saprospirales bacterium]